MALFGGAYFGRRALAFAAPLGAMLLSDAILGFHSGMPYVYGSVALIVLIGWAVAKRMTPLGDCRRRRRQLGPVLRRHQLRRLG